MSRRRSGRSVARYWNYCNITKIIYEYINSECLLGHFLSEFSDQFLVYLDDSVFLLQSSTLFCRLFAVDRNSGFRHVVCLHSLLYPILL